MKILRLLPIVIFLGCTSPQPTPVLEGEPITDLAVAVRQSVDRALPFIEREGTAWMEGRVPIQEGSGCVSCHHVGYALWSHAEARRVGIDTLAPAFEALAENAIAFLNRPSIPRALSAGQIMFAEPQQAKHLRQSMLDLQNATGAWSAVGQFPTQRRPIAESDAIATMYALLALREVGSETEDLDSVHTNALGWLDEQPPGESTEWLAWRLVLANALSSEQQILALRQELIDRQRSDGGWGWFADSQSDAFSTGQGLYALSLVHGGSSTSALTPAVENAVRYLIQRQDDDGSWQTASTLVSDQPSPDKDVIYHFWGTAWATLGLARSLDS